MEKGQATVFFVSALLIAGALGVAVMANSDNAGGERSVVDARDRTVMIPDHVDKIVCLSAGSVRLVTYFGQEAVDKIVGIDLNDANKQMLPANYYKATYRIAYDIQSIECVGSEDSYKSIIRTGADVIISSMESIEKLNTVQNMTGIPVVAVSAQGNVIVGDDAFNKNISVVGEVLGMESRATELINGVSQLISELRSKAFTSNHNCYVGGMMYMKVGGFYETAGKYFSLDIVGGKNVMPDKNNGNPYLTTKGNLQHISQTSPIEYMFVDSIKLSDSKSEFVADRSDLSLIPAVENHKLYSTFVSKYYGSNWENEIINAYGIGSVIDPGNFAGLKDFGNRVYELFFGKTDLYDSVVEKQTGFTKLESWFE